MYEINSFKSVTTNSKTFNTFDITFKIFLKHKIRIHSNDIPLITKKLPFICQEIASMYIKTQKNEYYRVFRL